MRIHQPNTFANFDKIILIEELGNKKTPNAIATSKQITNIAQAPTKTVDLLKKT